MELNKQDEKLLQELLKKYKQGIISGIYPGTNITFTPTGCRDKIISYISSGTGGGIESIQEGTNITVDDTDPLNPIVSVQDITLSGEVTGSTSLSAIDKTAITNKTTETIVGTDYVLFGDSSDSNNLKKGLVSDIVALVSGGGSGGGNIVKTITPADFSGSDYIDSDLIGKVPDTGFMLFADGGSGVLLHNGDGYTFDDTTGTITTDSGDYRLIIIT